MEEWKMDWSYLLFGLAQLVVAVLLGAIVTYLSVVLFDRATKNIDEWAELRKGNLAIGIVLGAIVVAVAWIVRPALKLPMADWDIGLYRVVAALGIEALRLFRVAAARGHDLAALEEGVRNHYGLVEQSAGIVA